MQNLFHYVARSAQYPISIYPAWLRIGLTVVVPLGIAVTVPLRSSHLTARRGDGGRGGRGDDRDCRAEPGAVAARPAPLLGRQFLN